VPPLIVRLKMIRSFVIMSCLLLMIGCRSAPKTARVINGANGRVLFSLVAEYSAIHGRMPPNLYVLDFSNCSTGDHQTTIADLRSVSKDRKCETDFLYFWSPQRLETLDPQLIVLASPFPATSSDGRLVVRASGSSEFLSEYDFQQAMTTNIKPGEQE
jgi:hypothetical protein